MQSHDKRTGPSPQTAWFTTTRWSVVLAAGQAATPGAQAALEQLCRIYWYPLYAYVRRKGHATHDAEDLTQTFFVRLLERNDFNQVHPAKGKFRSFLLAALNHFLSDEWDKARAAKRGGGVPLLSLDEPAPEDRYRLEPVDPVNAEQLFERRCVKGSVLNGG